MLEDEGGGFFVGQGVDQRSRVVGQDFMLMGTQNGERGLKNGGSREGYAKANGDP